MKLAEALVERKAAHDRLTELQERLQRVAFVQEGERPPEGPADLLAELAATADRLERLIVAINRTNARAVLPAGDTVMAAIARRDVLKLRLAALDNLLRAGGQAHYRARGAEIRFVPTLPIADLQRQRDGLAKAYREVDAAIQAANWATDLAD